MAKPSASLAGASPRGERTRRALVEAAETLFAERGFEATRLEDVAQAVGIRRASIVYHFRDKPALYDAVLADVLDDLHDRVIAVLDPPGPLARQIPDAVGAWVDAVAARPSLARLLLREVADARPEAPSRLAAHLTPFFELARRVAERARYDDSLRRARLDPVHVASTVAGATLFFVAAMPLLLPDADFDPLAPEQLAAYRAELLGITRRLLGLPAAARPTR